MNLQTIAEDLRATKLEWAEEAADYLDTLTDNTSAIDRATQVIAGSWPEGQAIEQTRARILAQDLARTGLLTADNTAGKGAPNESAERARRIIERTILGRQTSAPSTARAVADALAQAGRLAPDLPEPHALTPDTDPDWAQAYRDEWEWVPDIQFHCESSDFFINVKDSDTNGGFGEAQEEWLDMKPTQLRGIASTLLAAANHLDKETNE